MLSRNSKGTGHDTVEFGALPQKVGLADDIPREAMTASTLQCTHCKPGTMSGYYVAPAVAASCDSCHKKCDTTSVAGDDAIHACHDKCQQDRDDCPPPIELVLLGVFVVLCCIGGAVLFLLYCLCCRKKDKGADGKDTTVFANPMASEDK